jgi:hypothetical protein
VGGGRMKWIKSENLSKQLDTQVYISEQLSKHWDKEYINKQQILEKAKKLPKNLYDHIPKSKENPVPISILYKNGEVFFQVTTSINQKPDEPICIGGKLFLWGLAILIAICLVITFVSELFGKHGALLVIIIFFVIVFLGFANNRSS